MARPCAICISPDCSEFDQKAASNKHTKAGLARAHGFSEDAVRNHIQNHLPRKLQKAREAKESAEADTMVSALKALKISAEGILETAKKGNDPRTALLAIREIKGIAETLGKASGELQNQPAVVVQVGAQPAAPVHPGPDFANEQPEDIAAELFQGLSEDLGAEKYERVIRILAAQLPIPTTGEPVPGANQLTITPQSRFAPGR